MKIKWRYFVPKIINIGLDLLELYEHITGVRNFLRHSVYSDTQELSVCVQIKAVLNWYYKVFKEESVLIFNSQENIQYYWNRLRQLLHLKVPETAKEPEATLPPVCCCHYLLFWLSSHVLFYPSYFVSLKRISCGYFWAPLSCKFMVDGNICSEGGIVFSTVCVRVCLTVCLFVCHTITPETLQLSSQHFQVIILW